MAAAIEKKNTPHSIYQVVYANKQIFFIRDFDILNHVISLHTGNEIQLRYSFIPKCRMFPFHPLGFTVVTNEFFILD